jgi:NCAIR mutase (PurE)-related protein
MIRGCGYRELGFAKVDTARLRRRGFPEVVYCPGKSRAQIIKVSREIMKGRGPLLLTRLLKKDYLVLKKSLPGLRYAQGGRLAYIGRLRRAETGPSALIVTGGTADIPVAEEAAVTLMLMGFGAVRLYDVGVAGVHRLLDNEAMLRQAQVIIVVAGMEGALASLVGGLVAAPVIAVPTSVGYGAHFSGVAALLTMLNSCSPGVTVVNIDNGFGAGYMAGLILRGWQKEAQGVRHRNIGGRKAQNRSYVK